MSNRTMQTIELTHQDDSKTTRLNFKHIVKMIPEYQIEDGDAYILYFKNGALLSISKDEHECWYYQPDENIDIMDGIQLLPKPELFDELVTMIKNRSNYNTSNDEWDVVK